MEVKGGSDIAIRRAKVNVIEVPDIKKLNMKTTIQYIKNLIPLSVRDFRYAWKDEQRKKKELRHNASFVKKILKDDQPIRLEYGAGGREMEGFYRVDRYEPCELYIDFGKDIMPLPDNSVDIIYSAHFFEHIRYPHPMREILQDALRVLKSEGEFSICVPDGRQYVDAYMHPEKYNDPRDICVWKPAYFHFSPIDYINYIAYLDNGEHKILFEPENLMGILKEAGFVDIQLRDADPKLDPKHHIESVYDSIFVTARKA
jgi:predicted SAM-dependent methyltransferase